MASTSSRARNDDVEGDKLVMSSYKVSSDIDVLTSSFPIPGFGLVPINAFVLQGREPVLVDTGAVVETEEFMTTLRSVIDPADLQWIWLTHTDFDHIGSLHQLLAENTRLRVLTTFLGAGIMTLSAPLPLDRVHLVNPGQKVTVGDRSLTAITPPTFDNPVTTGFYDDKSGAFFSADCFGALLSEVPQRADDLSFDELQQGQVLWATIDSPWLHKVDPEAFAKELDAIRVMDPTMVLSSHLPAASAGMTEGLLASLETVPRAQPFVGPDQVVLAQMTGGGVQRPSP
jgi:flavorubredoxin